MRVFTKLFTVCTLFCLTTFASTTKGASPIVKVTTVSPSKIEYTTAKCGVKIETTANEEIQKIGVCWGLNISPEPDYNNSNALVSDYNGVSYMPTIKNLEPGKTYHVRAFAKTKTNTFYGADSTFTLKEAPENAFLVANNKFVYFSPGNLQYQASTNTWRFAPHQYDCIGMKNERISETYDGWIDLFGWATSGYNCDNGGCYKPYDFTTKFIYGPTDDQSLVDEFKNCDWGVYNPISNGGNQVGQWRTLTKDEWEYLLSGRSNADKKRIYCCINGKNGIIFLPDNHQWPDGLAINSGNFYNNTIYELEEWEEIESIGGIFLPTTGYRHNNNVNGPTINNSGCYWSSSYGNINGGLKQVYHMGFSSGCKAGCSKTLASTGCSVRLVKDATF